MGVFGWYLKDRNIAKTSPMRMIIPHDVFKLFTCLSVGYSIQSNRVSCIRNSISSISQQESSGSHIPKEASLIEAKGDAAKFIVLELMYG